MSSAADAKLPQEVEKLLADMPVADRDWDALATRTVEQAMLAKDTAASLLDAPLPPEEGEEGFVGSEPAKEPEKEPATEPAVAKAPAPVSLAELARASVKKKNEGARDIALESLAVATQARAQVDEIAERVQAATRQARASVPDDDEAAKPIAPGASTKTEPPARPKKKAAAALPVAAPANVTAAQPSAARGPWIVAGFAVLAAAAAIAISQRPTSEQTLATHEASPAAPATAAPVLADPAKPAPAPAGAEPQGEAVAQPLPPVEGHAPMAHAPAAKGAPAVAAAVPSSVKPEAIVLEDEEPAAKPAAAAPPAPKMVPAELPRGGLPDKPSAGAAYAAIGPFMGSARACVSGHDDPSTARIVFASDGSVQSVSVSGPAAGTPAAGCIENALKKARVQPFAAPTFSMSAPIRPQ